MLRNACFLIEGKDLTKSEENRSKSIQTGTVFLATKGKGLISFLCLLVTPKVL